MAPGVGRQLGALVVISVLLVGCADDAAKVAETQEKSQLTTSLIDAAAAAKAQSDSTTAATYYRSALTREPDNVAAAIGLMQTLRIIGGLDEARAVAEKSLSLHPRDPAVMAEAAKVKLATGQIDDAIKLLEQAVAADGKDWKSRSALGLAYDRVGDYAHADQCYKDALAIAPDNASVLNNYGLSRAMANDLDGARALLLRAVASPNADMRVRQNLALVYALGGDMAKAEELTRHDLPPALANQALDYYRQLAAAATPPPQ
jgi:Flp pilus assembly protein TadD